MNEKPPKPRFTVVEPALSPIPPPRKLGEAGTNLWHAIQSEFVIADAGGTELLMQCCLAADRVEALSARIDQDGESVSTRSGLRSHPCLRDEIANRAFIVRTLQKLGITDEPIKPIGRPSRRG
jgi:hypothetical protein